MLPQRLNEDCKEAFIELILNTPKYKGKTFCFFAPFRGKNPSYHITIVDKSTGFGTVIPLSAKSAMVLEKENMKDIYVKMLDGLMIAADKHKDQSTQVDYIKNPLKAEGRTSKIQNIEKNNNATVEVYGWSKLIV